MYYMPHSHIWDAWLTCITCLTDVWQEPQSYVWHDSLTCEMSHWHLHDDVSLIETYRIHMWEMPHWYIWHASLMCERCFTHMYDMPHSHVRDVSLTFEWCLTHRDIPHSYVRDTSLVCMICLPHMWDASLTFEWCLTHRDIPHSRVRDAALMYDMSHSHVKDDSFICQYDMFANLNTCGVNLLEASTWPVLCAEWMVFGTPWHTARENPTASESVSPVFLFQFNALHIGVLFEHFFVWTCLCLFVELLVFGTAAWECFFLLICRHTVSAKYIRNAHKWCVCVFLVVLTWGWAIKRPRTRSTAARQVSNAHERDLVTNQNV